MGIQYIEVNGERLAILPASDLERLIEDAEDRSDEQAADAALRRRLSGEEEYFPQQVVERLMAGDNPVAVYRCHRGLTQMELATRIGMSSMVVSSIETGKNVGRISTLRKIATALAVDLEDVLPIEPETQIDS